MGDGHLSAPLDPLHQQPAHLWLPLPWLVETVRGGEGNRGRAVCGWRHLVPWAGQQGEPREDHGCWVCEPGRWCSGPSARVRTQLGLKAKSWLSWLRGYKSCSALLAGGGPHPRLRTSPRAALGGTEQETQVCQALRVIFFPQDSTKKGNEKWPPWLRFALEGCFLPAALLLCCNTGNLLLLTPGVVSNSQMVLTSVSCN